MRSDYSGVEELARKILHHSRRRITQLAPALLECIYIMPERVRPTPGPLSTDGRTLWFHPEQVVEDFRTDRDCVVRQLLHVTLHCLLGHLELRREAEHKKPFDCAADLKVAEFVRDVFGGPFVTVDGRNYQYFDDCGHIRPLYHRLAEGGRESGGLYRAGRQARLDDHDLWEPPQGGAQAAVGAGGGTEEDAGPNWADIRVSILEGKSGKLPGTGAGMLRESFAVEERGMSYEHFLRRFVSPRERMLLDPDSFDARWYHLGLELYGDVPLLEPSELSEPPVPDDIVIALDTSGSCDGDLCRRFLRETLGILRDISAGTSRFRVLLLQCDTKIQQEALLESAQQVEELFEGFQVRGFGGTDFCPVFDRVEELRADGTLPRVRGLLYLSDGWGSFPSTPADYPTVFLIPAEEDPAWPSQASWITRLYLNEHDFTLKEADAL